MFSDTNMGEPDTIEELPLKLVSITLLQLTLLLTKLFLYVSTSLNDHQPINPASFNALPVPTVLSYKFPNPSSNNVILFLVSVNVIEPGFIWLPYVSCGTLITTALLPRNLSFTRRPPSPSESP